MSRKFVVSRCPFFFFFFFEGLENLLEASLPFGPLARPRKAEVRGNFVRCVSLVP